MFDRSKRFIKYRVCPLFLCVVLFSLFVPVVSAADDIPVTGNWTATLAYTSSSDDFKGSFSFTIPREGSVLPVDTIEPTAVTAASYLYFNLDALLVDPDVAFSGSVGLYVSLYFRHASGTVYEISTEGSDEMELFYTDYLGRTQSASLELTKFIPANSSTRFGLSYKGSLTVPANEPVRDIGIRSTGTSNGYRRGKDFKSAEIIIPSMTVLATATDSELAQLEQLADAITEQNEILSAMYGDVISVCNAIYQRLGDMQATAELANTYFSEMITHLESIDNTTEQIYSLLQTQFTFLITAINTAASDVTGAITAQTDALIAYFDSVFSGAVGDLPEQSDDLDSQIGNVGSAENEYQSNASATFEQLSADFTGFTGGTLSGIALASNLFTQVWDALGTYSVVYSFPLLLGLCLLLIGRLSKHSGGQSSTDKERGDSDA